MDQHLCENAAARDLQSAVRHATFTRSANHNMSTVRERCKPGM